MANRHDSERLRGFCDRLTDRQTDICDSRVTFETEKSPSNSIHGSLKITFDIFDDMDYVAVGMDDFTFTTYIFFVTLFMSL